MTISKLAVKKPTTVLICFILAALLGIYCTATLPIDLYPDMDIPYIIVYTGYGNAGPEETEKSVTRTLESGLSSVTGLKKLQSRSSTGSSMVILEFEYGTNLDEAKAGIRDKIDMVRNYLPDAADSPIIFQMDPSMMPIMGLVVTGSRTPEELSSYVENIIEPRIEQIDGVASASLMGNYEKCIKVEVPRDRLDAYGLTITQICQMIGAQNITSSGGTISQGGNNYTISAEGTYKSVEDIKGTVVTYKVNGNRETVPVLLRDIADVYEGYKDQTSQAFMGEKACVMLMIQKQSGKNSVKTAEKCRKQLQNILKDLPSDVEIIEAFNTTDDINNTITNVVNSLLQGILLAVIVLYIFLRSVKSTFIIALSIPISVIITLTLMYFCGLTINMMTLSGLLLGIGMLVDNSIVILENIFSYRERDAKADVAAVLGSEEMIGSITSSTLTSVCIFLPMVMFQKMLGVMGQLFTSFAFTIIFSLLCSLLVAAVLVPVLSSKYLVVEKQSERKMPGWLQGFDGLMNRFFDWLDNAYAKGVGRVLKHRKLILIALVVTLVVSIGLIKVIGFIFMPPQPSTSVSVALEMPKGTNLETTREVMQQYEANVMRELKGVKYAMTSIGGSSFMGSSASDSNTATLRITLYKESEREADWDNEDSAKEKCRKYFNVFPGATFTFSSGFGGGFASSAISIVIRSDDLDLARAASREIQKVVKEKCADFVNETTSDLEDGLPQLKINMDRNRMYELGVTAYGAGAELNAAVNGKTASRYDDNGTQVDIMVGLAEQDKQKFGDLENIYVSNSMGQRVPFASFSRYEEDLAPVTIRRENQTRTIRISVDPKKGISINKVQEAIADAVKQNVVLDEKVMVTYEGSFEDMIEAVTKFSVIIIMAVLLVFAVMASQFESFKDPFIILFTIPLSFIGVIFIYLITHTMLNVVSVVGMLVLVGTIVNNGIVLVDYTNLLRKRGFALTEACIEAARSRLRPILMSTLTTVTSLIPMAFFPGETGAMTQPIGLTVLGGMTFGSMMTLFVMPVVYFIFNKKDEAKRLAELKAELEEPKKSSTEIKSEERKARGQKKIVKALEDKVEKAKTRTRTKKAAEEETKTEETDGGNE